MIFFQFNRTATTGTWDNNNEMQAVKSSHLRNKIIKIIELFLFSWNVSNQKTSITLLTKDNDVTIKLYQLKHKGY